MTPQLDRVTRGGADVRVALIDDVGAYADAVAPGPAGGVADALANDTGVVALPRWRGDGTRLFDESAQVLYAVDREPFAVTLYVVPGHPRARVALMRVVRELVSNRAQRAGDLLLHAAVFAAGGRAVAVAGPKRAGKTTLLVHALGEPAVRYVSNDRALVALDGERPRARGIPTLVSLRRTTLDLFPELARRQAAARYHYSQALAEQAPARAQHKPDREVVTPAQFCRLAGTSPLGQADLAAVVFPRVTNARGALEIRRLSDSEGAPLLTGALFGVQSGRWASEVFSVPSDPPAPDLPALAERCRALAARVPCFRCDMGLDAFAPGSARALLAALPL